MAHYEIMHDHEEGILICRIHGFIDDDIAICLARDWKAGIIENRRRHSTLKVLFDNSRGNVMSPKTAILMADTTRQFGQPGDRTAVLTENSLTKLQAKRTMTGNGEVFVSEKAARLWLSA
jgi:hypothetical protein